MPALQEEDDEDEYTDEDEDDEDDDEDEYEDDDDEYETDDEDDEAPAVSEPWYRRAYNAVNNSAVVR